MNLRHFMEFAIGVHDGALVCADGMSARFEGRFDVINGGLPAVALERTGFKKHIGLRGGEPFANVCGPWTRQGWPPVIERLRGVEAAGIRQPANSARGDACELPCNSIFLLKHVGFRDEQAHKFLADVSESDEG